LTARGGVGKEQGGARVRAREQGVAARDEEEEKEETADGTKKRTQIRFSRGDQTR
jgi:hypothetical protein